MNYPQPYPRPIQSAAFKSAPADFIVTENLAIDFANDGEHLWLYLKKIGLNTAYVARLLADWAGVPARDVGYSGLKDRQAVTYQWFSIRLPHKQAPEQDLLTFIQPHLKTGESLSIEQQAWHTKKLNRGTHKTNRFEIVLRHVAGDAHAIDQGLGQLTQTGVPNYFGEQRFGRDEGNIAKAEQFFQKIQSSGKPYRPNKCTAERDGLLISAARSHLFNEMLALRITQGHWATPMLGDAYNLNGSGSLFCADIDQEIAHRLQTGDIHPVAPLYGLGNPKTSQDAQALYDQVCHRQELTALTQGLQAVGAKLAYRPIRLMVEQLSWRWLDEETLALDFYLPKGSFATVVLAALVENLSQIA